jgi:hypothetical protein
MIVELCRLNQRFARNLTLSHRVEYRVEARGVCDVGAHRCRDKNQDEFHFWFSLEVVQKMWGGCNGNVTA